MTPLDEARADEASAEEGAVAHLPYSSGRAQRLADAQRDPGLFWLMAAAAVLAVLVSIPWAGALAP